MDMMNVREFAQHCWDRWGTPSAAAIAEFNILVNEAGAMTSTDEKGAHPPSQDPRTRSGPTWTQIGTKLSQYAAKVG
jgi:hypothetical protein